MERCRRVVCTVRQWFWGKTYVPIRSFALIASRCALTTTEQVDQDVRALSALASHFMECELIPITCCQMYKQRGKPGQGKSNLMACIWKCICNGVRRTPSTRERETSVVMMFAATLRGTHEQA